MRVRVRLPPPPASDDCLGKRAWRRYWQSQLIELAGLSVPRPGVKNPTPTWGWEEDCTAVWIGFNESVEAVACRIAVLSKGASIFGGKPVAFCSVYGPCSTSKETSWKAGDRISNCNLDRAINTTDSMEVPSIKGSTDNSNDGKYDSVYGPESDRAAVLPINSTTKASVEAAATVPCTSLVLLVPERWMGGLTTPTGELLPELREQPDVHIDIGNSVHGDSKDSPATANSDDETGAKKEEFQVAGGYRTVEICGSLSTGTYLTLNHMSILLERTWLELSPDGSSPMPPPQWQHRPPSVAAAAAVASTTPAMSAAGPTTAIFSLAMLIPKSIVAVIIGAGGSNIRSLLYQSGASHMTVMELVSEGPSTKGYSVLHISGDAISCSIALEIVRHQIGLARLRETLARTQSTLLRDGATSTAMRSPSTIEHCEMTLHSRVCGHLIGIGGTNISRLQMITGATMIWADPVDVDDGGERTEGVAHYRTSAAIKSTLPRSITVLGDKATQILAQGYIFSAMCHPPYSTAFWSPRFDSPRNNSKGNVSRRVRVRVRVSPAIAEALAGHGSTDTKKLDEMSSLSGTQVVLLAAVAQGERARTQAYSAGAERFRPLKISPRSPPGLITSGRVFAVEFSGTMQASLAAQDLLREFLAEFALRESKCNKTESAISSPTSVRRRSMHSDSTEEAGLLLPPAAAELRDDGVFPSIGDGPVHAPAKPVVWPQLTGPLNEATEMSSRAEAAEAAIA